MNFAQKWSRNWSTANNQPSQVTMQKESHTMVGTEHNTKRRIFMTIIGRLHEGNSMGIQCSVENTMCSHFDNSDNISTE